MKKENRKTEIALLVIVLIVFAAVFGLMARDGKKQTMEEIRQLSSGWYYLEDGQKTEITFPAVIKAKDDESLILYNDGITEKDAGKVITTRGAQYGLEIALNGEILYEYEDSDFVRNTQMKSKLNCDGEIPVDTQGGTLTLTYMQPQRGQYEISAIYMGSGSAVTLYHLWQMAFVLGVAFCFIILSVISILVAIYLKCHQMSDNRFLDVAMFLGICSIWLITDSSVVQTGSSYPALVCTISFYMFMLFSVPMLHFAQKIGDMKKYRILDLGIGLFYFNAVVQGILNYLNIFEFVDMLFVTHILLMMWVLISTGLLWKEYRKKPQRGTGMVIVAYTVVSASGILALLLYWLFDISYYGSIFETGILLFLIIIIAYTVMTLAADVRYRTEKQAYERLTKEDWMTGMQSREPFENLITGMQGKAAQYQDVLLFFMDINHLRRVNADYGRAAGDELIVAAARCMENVFGKNGKCYRIGGDEFAAVIFNPDMNGEAFCAQLDRELQNYNRNNRYALSVSRGFSSIREKNGKLKTISEWKYQADAAMYQNKSKEGKSI